MPPSALAVPLSTLPGRRLTTSLGPCTPFQHLFLRAKDTDTFNFTPPPPHCIKHSILCTILYLTVFAQDVLAIVPYRYFRAHPPFPQLSGVPLCLHRSLLTSTLKMSTWVVSNLFSVIFKWGLKWEFKSCQAALVTQVVGEADTLLIDSATSARHRRNFSRTLRTQGTQLRNHDFSPINLF